MADRLEVSIQWTGGSERIGVDLRSGRASVRRELASRSFAEQRTFSLEPDELGHLIQSAAQLDASEQAGVEEDLHALGEQRVRLWRGSQVVTVHNRRGGIERGVARALLEAAQRIAERRLPWPRADP